jgi:hypothetical protein
LAVDSDAQTSKDSGTYHESIAQSVLFPVVLLLA